MATRPAALTVEFAEAAPSRSASAVLADYWTLTKPEVNLLIVITTLAGFCLALPSHLQHFPTVLLINALLGTLLVASGTATLNQFIERDFDAQMRRTAKRPLAAGRIASSSGLWFGLLLSCAGCVYLGLAVNVLASLLALITLLSYLFLYTPLKRKTPLCTLVGALPGAMPPLIGWAAAAGRLNLEAWTLYAILFLWQFPHFMAIAWMYREDYARAGYMVLPLGKTKGSFMALQCVLPCLLLIPASLVPLLHSHSGFSYLLAVLYFSSVFVVCAVRLSSERSNAVARRLLLASIIYLPLILVVMLVGRS
jgi:protoheme IX farnesyltransferase